MNSDFIVALHSLVYLKHKGTKVSSDELAKNVCTNPVRIRKVMAGLREKGYVSTKEGVDGGYMYSATHPIRLLDVYTALNFTLIHSNWKSGNLNASCLISSGMAGVMEDLSAQLEAACREKLANIYIDDIEQQLISKGV